MEDSEGEDRKKDGNDDNFDDDDNTENSDDEKETVTVTIPYNRIHNDHKVLLKPKWNKPICMVLDWNSLWDIDIKLRVFYHDLPCDKVNITKHKSLEFLVEDDDVIGKKGDHIFYYTTYQRCLIVDKSNWAYCKEEQIQNW